MAESETSCRLRLQATEFWLDRMAELSQVGRPITASDIETWLDILRNGEAADYYTENGKVNPALFDEDNRIRYPVYESVALRILDILRPA